MFVSVIAFKYSLLVSQRSYKQFLNYLIQFYLNNNNKSLPFNSAHYIVLYPQNGNRIVIIDSVTFLHPMYTHRTSQWILVWRTHTCIGPLDLDPSPSHNPHITCDTANDTIQCNSFRIILKVATTMHNIFHQRSPPYFKDLVTFSVSGVTPASSTAVISSQLRRCPSNNNSVRSSRFFSPGPDI